MPSRKKALSCAVALCLLTAPDLAAQCPDGSPPPCSSAPRRATARVVVAPPALAVRKLSFLVLPFRNLSRAAEHAWLVEGSPVLIADALSRNEALKVVPDERLYPALERAGLTAGGVMDLARVRRVAEETGGWTAVSGEILALGNRLRVSARAFDVVTNAEVMRAVEEAGPGEDVRAVYERLSTRLVRITGTGTAAADLATTTTRSVDAYRAFVRGVVHENRSEAKRARDAFLEAVRLDSTYAQAYARLAEAEINVDPRQITQPQSPMYRYSARAAALAGNLPARDREIVLATNDILSARFASARERLVRLLAQDSLHIDALERMSGLELFDPILVPRGNGMRPRGSVNRGQALAKRVLELDPSRHQLYGSLVQTYLLASGMPPGLVFAFRTEAASLPALFAGAPAMSFVPLLRDTMELVPIDSLSFVPADTLAASRARAVSAAKQWVQRWLTAGAGQAEPHLWASRVYAQAGEWAAALRELEAADSIGVETGIENVPARRMSLLARLNRYTEGRAIADSLLDANAFEAARLNAYAFEGAGWAFTLFVLDRQYDRADTLLGKLAAALAPAAVMNPELPASALAQLVLTGAVRQFFTIPGAVRLTVLDRLLTDARALPATSVLRRQLPFHGSVLARDTSISRGELSARLARAARNLAASDEDLAYALAVTAALDTATKRSLDTEPWFARRGAETRALRVANEGRFRPVSAVVTDSAATFTWSVTGDAFGWNRTGTPMGDSDYLWEATFKVLGGEYEALADVAHRPGSPPASGNLQALLGAALPVLHQILSPDTTVAHRVVSRTAVRLEPATGGLRLVLRDPRLVAALRQERPATVTMEFRPCVEKCVKVEVPFTYP